MEIIYNIFLGVGITILSILALYIGFAILTFFGAVIIASIKYKNPFRFMQIISK